MGGEDLQQGGVFSYVSLEERIPKSHGSCAPQLLRVPIEPLAAASLPGPAFNGLRPLPHVT